MLCCTVFLSFFIFAFHFSPSAFLISFIFEFLLHFYTYSLLNFGFSFFTRLSFALVFRTCLSPFPTLYLLPSFTKSENARGLCTIWGNLVPLFHEKQGVWNSFSRQKRSIEICLTECHHFLVQKGETNSGKFCIDLQLQISDKRSPFLASAV